MNREISNDDNGHPLSELPTRGKRGKKRENLIAKKNPKPTNAQSNFPFHHCHQSIEKFKLKHIPLDPMVDFFLNFPVSILIIILSLSSCAVTRY